MYQAWPWPAAGTDAQAANVVGTTNTTAAGVTWPASTYGQYAVPGAVPPQWAWATTGQYGCAPPTGQSFPPNWPTTNSQVTSESTSVTTSNEATATSKQPAASNETVSLEDEKMSQLRALAQQWSNQQQTSPWGVAPTAAAAMSGSLTTAAMSMPPPMQAGAQWPQAAWNQGSWTTGQWPQQQWSQSWIPPSQQQSNANQTSTNSDSSAGQSVSSGKQQKEITDKLDEIDKEEKEFDHQFEEWEKQFADWKEKNMSHPDKEAFSNYEKQWQEWREQLLQKKEQMQQKKDNLHSEMKKLNEGNSKTESTSAEQKIPGLDFHDDKVSDASSSIPQFSGSMAPYMYMPQSQPFMFPPNVPPPPTHVPLQQPPPRNAPPLNVANHPPPNVSNAQPSSNVGNPRFPNVGSHQSPIDQSPKKPLLATPPAIGLLPPPGGRFENRPGDYKSTDDSVGQPDGRDNLGNNNQPIEEESYEDEWNFPEQNPSMNFSRGRGQARGRGRPPPQWNDGDNFEQPFEEDFPVAFDGTPGSFRSPEEDFQNRGSSSEGLGRGLLGEGRGPPGRMGSGLPGEGSGRGFRGGLGKGPHGRVLGEGLGRGSPDEGLDIGPSGEGLSRGGGFGRGPRGGIARGSRGGMGRGVLADGLGRGSLDEGFDFGPGEGFGRGPGEGFGRGLPGEGFGRGPPGEGFGRGSRGGLGRGPRGGLGRGPSGEGFGRSPLGEGFDQESFGGLGRGLSGEELNRSPLGEGRGRGIRGGLGRGIPSGLGRGSLGGLDSEEFGRCPSDEGFGIRGPPNERFGNRGPSGPGLGNRGPPGPGLGNRGPPGPGLGNRGPPAPGLGNRSEDFGGKGPSSEGIGPRDSPNPGLGKRCPPDQGPGNRGIPNEEFENEGPPGNKGPLGAEFGNRGPNEWNRGPPSLGLGNRGPPNEGFGNRGPPNEMFGNRGPPNERFGYRGPPAGGLGNRGVPDVDFRKQPLDPMRSNLSGDNFSNSGDPSTKRFKGNLPKKFDDGTSEFPRNSGDFPNRFDDMQSREFEAHPARKFEGMNKPNLSQPRLRDSSAKDVNPDAFNPDACLMSTKFPPDPPREENEDFTNDNVDERQFGGAQFPAPPGRNFNMGDPNCRIPPDGGRFPPKRDPFDQHPPLRDIPFDEEDPRLYDERPRFPGYQFHDMEPHPRMRNERFPINRDPFLGDDLRVKRKLDHPQFPDFSDEEGHFPPFGFPDDSGPPRFMCNDPYDGSGPGRPPPPFHDRRFMEELQRNSIDYTHRPASCVVGDDFGHKYDAFDQQFGSDLINYRDSYYMGHIPPPPLPVIFSQVDVDAIDYNHGTKPLVTSVNHAKKATQENKSPFSNKAVFDYAHRREISPLRDQNWGPDEQVGPPFRDRNMPRPPDRNMGRPMDRNMSRPMDRNMARPTNQNWERNHQDRGFEKDRIRDRDKEKSDHDKGRTERDKEGSERDRERTDRNKERTDRIKEKSDRRVRDDRRDRDEKRDDRSNDRSKEKDRSGPDRRYRWENRNAPKEKSPEKQGLRKQNGDRNGKQTIPQIPSSDVFKTDSIGETDQIKDLLDPPNRFNRPKQLVIILRGLPGSGKSYVAKLIKDKEVEHGGCTPRILSLDDYFMVEVEVMETDPDTGKKIKKKEFKYEYEACMEESYRTSLLRSFKKTIDERFFPFIIVDAVHNETKHYEPMWSYAKQRGFQVYIAEMDSTDMGSCHKRNIHSRTLEDIQKIKAKWDKKPKHFLNLDTRPLLQDVAIPEVEMEDLVVTEQDKSDKKKDDDDEEEDDKNESTMPFHTPSRWEKLEATEEKLDKLDGLRASKKKHSTMEDYLQLPEDYEDRQCQPGKKRVRWADLEQRKEQDRMRAIGFVVGQTDWSKMTDPSQADKALTKTKYI